MLILCLAEDSHETSSLIFSKDKIKDNKSVVCCNIACRFKG